MSHRPLLVLCAVGVLLRLVFLVLAGDLELRSDEANYVYLALSWNHFGFYSDSYRYLWPPGYPFLLAVGLEWLGLTGLFAVKLLQVAASASIGLSTMHIARRVFDMRAAKVAGMLWAGYLPLIGFSHYLWSETVFLALLMPAIYLVLTVLQDEGGSPDRRLVLAGVLFAGALYFKEAPQYLALAVAGLLVGFAPKASGWEGLRRATLFLLALGVVILPWALRNYEVYDRFVPVGTSLGENAYGGLNASYQNYDLTAFRRTSEIGLAPERIGRRWFVEIDPASRWPRAEEILNTPDRLRENLGRGLAFAANHPGWFVRSRIKKLADFTAPMSFFLRHMALGLYDGGALGLGGVRQVLVLWALLGPLAVQLLALPGYLLALRDRAGRWLIGTVVLYFVSTSLIVAMSRFRIPIVPLLIVLVAGLVSRRAERPWRLDRWRTVPLAVGALLLLFLWWVDLPETMAVATHAWRAGGG